MSTINAFIRINESLKVVFEGKNEVALADFGAYRSMVPVLLAHGMIKEQNGCFELLEKGKQRRGEQPVPPVRKVLPMSNHRAWVRMPSGSRLDLVNPRSHDWSDEDLATGLSRTFRWGGHSAWPLPMSVAQHSLLVLELRRMYSPVPLDKQTELRELLHDAEEGLLGFDCLSVLKPVLGEAFKLLSERLTDAVFTRYGIPDWTPEEKVAHKRADVLAAASEAVFVAGWHRDELKTVLGIMTEPQAEDPLVAIYGGTPWEPWPAEVAAERFLSVLHDIASPMSVAA